MFGKENKVKKAIQRIQSFEPISNGLFDTPYYVAYSGGKDSDCIRILCDLAGVKYELVHNHTTVDAPETVRYVRGIPGVKVNYPELSMWQLIVKKKMPPTRLVRYCCEYLKERGGRNRFVVTGVRWSESSRRLNSRASLEVQAVKRSERLMLNADNDESRMMLENCQMKGSRVLNPIVDWTDEDVWEFLDYYGCKSNPLYQEGFSRIGCVGCPMAGNSRWFEFQRYPVYQDNYIKAFQRMLEANHFTTAYTWETGQDVFSWWMGKATYSKQLEGQLVFA